jgi:lipoprotein
LIAVSRSSEPVNLDVTQGAALLLAVGGVSLVSGCLTLSPDSGCAVRLG